MSENGRLLIGLAPDGAPCVAVATAAVHRKRVGTEHWGQVTADRFPAPSDVDDVPLAPLEENADFGMSDMDTEPPPSPDSPAQDQSAAPGRTTHRAPATREDEDWDASPW